MFILHTLLYNLVPVLFPQKMGGAGKGPFAAPPIFWGKSPGDEAGYYMRAYFDHFYAVYEIA